MSLTVCLAAQMHPREGGWYFLNWALGLRALGCQVIWLKGVDPKIPPEEVQGAVAAFRSRLERYDLAGAVALYSRTSEPLSSAATAGCLELEAACGADLLLNLAYGSPADVVRHFRRSALVDIDPGLTQIWVSEGQMPLARHDVYFTIGETVGQPGAQFPDCGLEWHYTPPLVFLPEWPAVRA